MIEEGVDPGTGVEGISDDGMDSESLAKELETKPVETSGNIVMDKLGGFLNTVASAAMPNIVAKAAEKDKDTMKEDVKRLHGTYGM